jgi:hypothetical protein
VSDFTLLVRTVKGSDMARQEEETYKLLKDVVKTYEVAGNGGRMEGRLAEFWAAILRLKQVVEQGYSTNGRFDWSIESEQELLRVSPFETDWTACSSAEHGSIHVQIFKEQGKALTALRNVAQDQKFDVKTLEEGFPLVI